MRFEEVSITNGRVSSITSNCFNFFMSLVREGSKSIEPYLSYFPAAAYVDLIEHIYLNDLIDDITFLTRLRSKVFSLFVFKL